MGRFFTVVFFVVMTFLAGDLLTVRLTGVRLTDAVVLTDLVLGVTFDIVVVVTFFVAVRGTEDERVFLTVVDTVFFGFETFFAVAPPV